jgi:hypothetical protein
MLIEAIGGAISGSLALLADAGHMLTDSAALLPKAAGERCRYPEPGQGSANANAPWCRPLIVIIITLSMTTAKPTAPPSN